MFKSYKKLIKYLSDIWELLREHIYTMHREVQNIERDMRKISEIENDTQKILSDTQILKGKIEDIEGLLFEKDTKLIIYNGKKYRIVESQLSKSIGNAATLDLSCIETWNNRRCL